jgi:hypothetical protein
MLRQAVDGENRRRHQQGLPRYIEDPMILDGMATLIIEHDREMSTRRRRAVEMSRRRRAVEKGNNSNANYH